MKLLSYLTVGLGLSLGGATVAREAPVATPAAVVLINGEVYTPSGWSQAVGIRDGRVIAVGSDAEVRGQTGPDAQVIDLAGKTVFPGLYDMHVHPLSAGTLMVQCRFDQGASPQQVLDRVGACVRDRKPGEWISGGQWQAIAFGTTPPTRQMLDKVAPNNPVILKDVSGHSVWVNSLALRLAKIDRDTKVPPGGVIERDAAGDPTGIIRESALTMIRSAVPPLPVSENAAAIGRALDTLVSYGVTSLTDAGVTQDMADAYKLLSAQGRLTPRVQACLLYGKLWTGRGDFETLLANRERYHLPHLTPDCVKFFVDGVPTESHTAAMIDPYIDHDHGASPGGDDRGSLQLPRDELTRMIRRIDQLGLVGKFHAVGDEASNAVLDAIEAAGKGRRSAQPRHSIAHTTFITRTNLARANRLGVTLEFSPYLWFPAIINDDIIKAVGQARVERIWPVREGIDSGALSIVGSDWPSGTPTMSPWIALEALVTRRAPGGARGDQTLAPKEAITLAEAVKLFTVNGARQQGSPDRSGTIEVGRDADLIVLDRNPFRIPITDVHNVTVLRTIIGGRTVYQKTN